MDADAFVSALDDDPVRALDAFGPMVPELAAMRTCPQPSNHHSEGSVWDHTRLALRMLTDLPAQIGRFAGHALRAAGCWPLDLPARTVQQALTVLLHDIAKPVTRAGPDGAWTYHGHDRVGAALAADLIADLGLESAAVSRGLHVDREAVRWQIDNHLFWLNTDVDTVTDRAVARRFVDGHNGDPRGEDLRVLSWCDTLGSRGPDGDPHVALLVAAEARIAATRARADVPAPRPPLDGRTVMRELDLAPGPRVGAVIDWLAERDLSGAEAVAVLRQERERLRSDDL